MIRIEPSGQWGESGVRREDSVRSRQSVNMSEKSASRNLAVPTTPGLTRGIVIIGSGPNSQTDEAELATGSRHGFNFWFDPETKELFRPLHSQGYALRMPEASALVMASRISSAVAVGL
jgi:hypothetical protein